MLLLTDEQVKTLTRMPDLVSAIHDGYMSEAKGEVEIPDRINLDSTPGFFRLMPAVAQGIGLMGFKVFNQMASGGVQYLIGLLDEKSGELLSLLDGAYLTAARTGATTGVAAGLLAPGRISEIGVIGSGLEAETNLEAVVSVLKPQRVKVFSPNVERRHAFAAKMRERLTVEVLPVADPAEAGGAPVVVVATNTGVNTGRIALRGAWLSPGATVLSIGSTMPTLRELDEEVFSRATLVVSDAPEQARAESGDLIAADQGGLLEGKLLTLAELAARGGVGTEEKSIRVFKSVGTALQDLIAAKVIFDLASGGVSGSAVELLRTKKPVGQ